MVDQIEGVALKSRPAEAETPTKPQGKRETFDRRVREMAHRIGTEAVERALDQAA